jgi:hypothetical protein
MFWGFVLCETSGVFLGRFFGYILEKMMGGVIGLERRKVGKRVVYLREVRPRSEGGGRGGDEGVVIDSGDEGVEMGLEDGSTLGEEVLLKQRVVVGFSGIVDGVKDILEIQERYRDIRKMVKRLRGMFRRLWDYFMLNVTDWCRLSGVE